MDKQFEATIGLEIHAELRTKTKMFCDSRNDPDEKSPNVNVCPVCLAHPGVLPVINREAVRHVLRVGVALGGELADYTEFDRKNYFYPDLPKGYQISQYEYPLVKGGTLNGVPITRVHLEEDTASSVHEEGKGTLIDFNRSGVPLMELVTEPEIKSAAEAAEFARELQLVLRTLGASQANMEKGEMRVEANVSIALPGAGLGTKVEIKNLNSFRAMERAVEYEVRRQSEVLLRGEKVQQETRGWDETKQSTFPQRVKEGSADYRYFPDPDLPSLQLLELGEFRTDSLRASLPELPSARRARYVAKGAKAEDAELYVREERFGDFFDAVLREGEKSPEFSASLASNYIANDLVKIIRDIDERDSGISHEIPISARDFNEIIDLLAHRKISSRAGKDLLKKALETGESPLALAERLGLLTRGTEADIQAVVDAVISENQGVVADYRAGKDAALEYLLGQAMKKLGGAGDPAVLRKMFGDRLGTSS
jgi:aspartyl-tRNA(Asn)/glutamyl-tRNA(Gln) amidotransferase subunit B